MLVLILNAKKAYELITNTLKENININTLREIHKEIRNVISRYYFILFQSESLGELNAHEYFSKSCFIINKNKNIKIYNNLSKIKKIKKYKFLNRSKKKFFF